MAATRSSPASYSPLTALTLDPVPRFQIFFDGISERKIARDSIDSLRGGCCSKTCGSDADVATNETTQCAAGRTATDEH